MKQQADIRKRDRFLFWRTDFVGIAMMVSGALLLAVNFGIVQASQLVLARVLGILAMVAGLVFLFFAGAKQLAHMVRRPPPACCSPWHGRPGVLGQDVFMKPLAAKLTAPLRPDLPRHVPGTAQSLVALHTSGAFLGAGLRRSTVRRLPSSGEPAPSP